ncbi:MAG TPA: NADPH-dependent oxidoreductase [Verrucomicrobiales bacterium]|nr:NADPH-dependent oxidoreductase [Verrucomicrobiales bacterium]
MIAIVSGTNRPGSSTRKVVAVIEAIHRRLRQVTTLIDLAHLPPGIFDPGSYAGKPAAFRPFAETVLAARGLVVVTPEYNGGIPGVLKYFVDMLKFPESFEGKPVCFVGLAAGMWGGLRPVEQLQQIFGYRNARLFPERVFLPRIGSLLTDQGAIADPAVQERLDRQAVGFIGFARRLKS